MATDVERLVVQMSADFKAYERELAKAQKTTVSGLKKIERDAQASASRMEKAFGGIGGKFGAALKGGLAGLSINALVSGISAAVKSVADIGDNADKLGLATDEFQQLQIVAQLAGIETTALASGLKKLAVNSSDAANGQGEFGKLLRANGVSIKDANGNLLSQIEIYKKVADLVKNAASEQDQAAIAFTALGKAGIDNLGLLQQGAAGVEAAMRQAATAGVSFSEVQIRKAQEFDDAIDVLSKRFDVTLKGAVVDAGIAGEQALIGLADALGMVNSSFDGVISKAQTAAYWIYKLNPLTAGAVNSFEYFQQRGQQIQNPAGLPATPANQSGKGSLPSNIDASTFNRVTPTILPPPAATATKNIVTDAERAQQAIDRVVSSLKFEGEQLQANTLQQKINSELRNAGVSATSAQGREIAALVTHNYNLEASQRLVNLATENYATQLAEVRDGQMEMARMGVDAFNRMAISGENVTDVLVSLADQLAEAAVNAALLGSGPMAALFGTSSSGGLIGSLLGGGASSFAGLYANGGQIPSGKIGIAGEAGPELIRGPANVIPMNRMTGGGGTHVTIVQNIAANGDKAVADIAYRQTQRALRDVEMRRPQADVERRLRTQ